MIFYYILVKISGYKLRVESHFVAGETINQLQLKKNNF